MGKRPHSWPTASDICCRRLQYPPMQPRAPGSFFPRADTDQSSRAAMEMSGSFHFIPIASTPYRLGMLAFNLIQSRDGVKVDIRKTNAELAEIDAELADLTERTAALRRKRGLVDQTLQAFLTTQARLNAEIRGISGAVGRDLHSAVIAQDAGAARVALDAGADPDYAAGSTALMEAAHRGDVATAAGARRRPQHGDDGQRKHPAANGIRRGPPRDGDAAAGPRRRSQQGNDGHWRHSNANGMRRGPRREGEAAAGPRRRSQQGNDGQSLKQAPR